MFNQKLLFYAGNGDDSTTKISIFIFEKINHFSFLLYSISSHKSNNKSSIIGYFIYMIANIKILSLFLLLASVPSFVNSLLPNRAVPVLHNPLDIEISQNEYISAAINSTHLQIYNAQTGQLLHGETSETDITTLSISRTTNTVAIGNSAEELLLVQIIFSQSGTQILQKKVNLPQKKSDTVNITDICWTADDQHVVIIYSDGLILGWNNNGLIPTGFQSEGTAIKATCSQKNAKQFVLAIVTPNQTYLAKYQIDFEAFNISRKDIFKLNAEITKINHISYNKISNAIYVAGDSDKIFKYSDPNNTEQVFLQHQGSSEIFKLKVIQDEKSYALVNSSYITFYQNDKVFRLSVETYQTNARTFALSQYGSRFIYLDVNGAANYFDTCLEGEYFDSVNNICRVCGTTCTTCAQSGDTCFSCVERHYLSAYSCLLCSSNCVACTSGSTCSTCSETFILSDQSSCVCRQTYVIGPDGKCGCGQNQVIDETEGKCICIENYEKDENGVCVEQKGGLPFWAFLIIIGAATVILCGIIIISVISVRRRNIEKDQEGRQPLASDN